MRRQGGRQIPKECQQKRHPFGQNPEALCRSLRSSATMILVLQHSGRVRRQVSNEMNRESLFRVYARDCGQLSASTGRDPLGRAPSSVADSIDRFGLKGALGPRERRELCRASVRRSADGAPGCGYRLQFQTRAGLHDLTGQSMTHNLLDLARDAGELLEIDPGAEATFV
jgi:hypothetical protein